MPADESHGAAAQSAAPKRSTAWYAGLVLAVTGGPSIPLFAGVAMSFTPGFMVLALALLALSPGAVLHGRCLARWGARGRWETLLLALTVVTAHFGIAAVARPTDVFRALASLVPLALLLLAGAALADLWARAPHARLHRGVARAFIVMAALALLGALGWEPPALTDWRKPVFPFSEPSMFALGFTPLLIYMSVTSRHRLACLITGVAAAVLLQNLTLFVGCLLAAFAGLRWRTLLVLAIPVLLGATQLDLSYYAERLDPSGESENLSNLVYLQGWQMVGESMANSHGFGTGFQQLGVNGTEAPVAELLRSLRDGEDMNLLDGGFVFAKLGSDFGAFGVLLALAHAVLAARSCAALRRVAVRGRWQPPAIVLAHCSVIAYAVELWVRGGGYFTGGSLLVTAALWLLGSARRRASRAAPALAVAT